MAGLLNSFFSVGPFWFGLICAMPAVANALQIVLVPVTARFMRARDLNLSQSWMNLGLWLSGFVAMAFLSRDAGAQAGLFFTLFFFIASLSLSMIMVSWMTWLSDFVPSRIRGRYMGRRNRFSNLSTVGFMLISLALLEWFDASRAAYLILIGLALAMRMVSVLVQHLLRSPDSTGGALATENWVKELVALRSNRPLIRFIVFGIVAGFWTAFLSTVAPMYAFNELGASAAEFTAYSIAATVAGAVFVRIWGKSIDRHGAVPIVIIGFVGWRLGDLGWIALTPETLNWMFLIWIWGGVLATGYLVASFTLLLKLIPKSSRAAGISLNLTATSIAAAIAPILAGWIINYAGESGWDLVTTYRIALLAGSLGSLLSVLFLIGTKEPETNPTLNTITGAMRTLRYLTVNQGLAFLSSASFVARRKGK
ncbi:major facilitator superfamily MFS_1 [Coraliomargarita akajimensis DSM 45221]|uniref:Major facilitator superfamily MFS_1 n=2 Tax=Coraliomargarita TaxID=442430 RepID=D5EPV0_CORAD|nr:major facilitator superfamily MFS_1 [Coraliomargarita akajimensis DSM 45221]